MARKAGEKKIKRPCLKCDKVFETTPEFRLCATCKQTIRDYGLDTGYQISSDAGNRHITPRIVLN